MKIAGIIAEYNPFHNGHKYQIAKTRQAGITHVVCIMSGNCVQRGEIALVDKHTRAEAAVNNGADLVIELPVPFSLGTAPDFARAGTEILKRMGCVDLLSFGSESGDVDSLVSLSEKTEAISQTDIKSEMSKGKTYPAAVASLLNEGESELLNGANNTLAIEYLKALKGTDIQPFTVRRTAPHDSDNTQDSYASASYIRDIIRGGGDASPFMPEGFKPSCVTDMKNVESVILYRLAAMAKDDFSAIPYSEGIESRLYEASRSCATLNELYDKVKAKNITHARVRRAIMLAALGVTKQDLAGELPYARILAMNDRGTEILSACKATTDIALSASLASLSQISEKAKRFAALDELSSRLLHLALNEKTDFVSEYSKKFGIIR